MTKVYAAVEYEKGVPYPGEILDNELYLDRDKAIERRDEADENGYKGFRNIVKEYELVD